MFVYLDDILIFSPDKEKHVVHVRQVLQKLLDNQFYVKAEKCHFDQMQMDPAEVSAVANWPTPDSRKSSAVPRVCQFLQKVNPQL